MRRGRAFNNPDKYSTYGWMVVNMAGLEYYPPHTSVFKVEEAPVAVMEKAY